MRKLLLVLSLLSLQQPAFAQLDKSDNEIYLNGKMRGVVFCAAFKSGARTLQQVVDYRDTYKSADLYMSDLVYRYSDARQKDVFKKGWIDQMTQGCPTQMRNFYK